MSTFTVETLEIWRRTYTVEADGPAKALLYVREGDEAPDATPLEYSHTVHPNQWVVRDEAGEHYDPEALL